MSIVEKILMEARDGDLQAFVNGVKALQSRYEAQGCTVEMDLRQHQSLHLNLIKIPKEKQGQGLGRQFMTELTGLCDDHGIICTLSPSDDYGSNLNRLNQFYRSFGFRKNVGRKADHRFWAGMVREPKGQVAMNESAAPYFDYKIEKGEDGARITADFDGDQAGYVSVEMWDADSLLRYELPEVADQLGDLIGDAMCSMVKQIEVDDYYRNTGLGSSLMNRAMKYTKRNGAEYCFLNAHPIGDNQISLYALQNFYQKLGFAELLDQGGNKIMYKKL